MKTLVEKLLPWPSDRWKKNNTVKSKKKSPTQKYIPQPPPDNMQFESHGEGIDQNILVLGQYILYECEDLTQRLIGGQGKVTLISHY